jgi:hypothetical protein
MDGAGECALVHVALVHVALVHVATILPPQQGAAMIPQTPPDAAAAREAAATASDAAPVHHARRGARAGRIFRRATLRRAMGEAVLIFLAGRLLAMVPATFWPALIFPAVLVLRLVLGFSPPVWAAARVVSTRREKMSRRFWRLGPLLAALCTLVDAAVALALGEASLFGGAAGPPDLARFGLHGSLHLTVGDFALGELALFVELAIYFTIAVVCTRLVNGGFMRFTMPTGNGRVTL